MVDVRNPAARLENCLQQFNQLPKDRSGFSVVCELWGLDDSALRDQMVAAQRVADLVSLGVDIRTKAEASNVGAMALMNYEQVETTLFNLGLLRTHNLAQILEPMQPTAWTSLAQLRMLFAQDANQELQLDNLEMDDLLSEVSNLIIQVQNDTTLDDVQRRLILDHLLAVQRTLLEVDIVGPERVEVATDGLMGALVRMCVRTNGFMHHPVTEASFKLVGLIATSLGVAADWNSLTAGGAMTLLALGGSGSDGTADD